MGGAPREDVRLREVEVIAECHRVGRVAFGRALCNRRRTAAPSAAAVGSAATVAPARTTAAGGSAAWWVRHDSAASCEDGEAAA